MSYDIFFVKADILGRLDEFIFIYIVPVYSSL